MTIALIEGLGRPGDLGAGDILGAILLVWFAGVLIITPLTLGLIAFPLSVFWFLHHRAGWGLWSFLAGGATAGLVPALALIGFTAGTGSADAVLTVLIFVLTATVTTGALWAVAYGRRNRRETSTAPAQPAALACPAARQTGAPDWRSPCPPLASRPSALPMRPSPPGCCPR